MKSNLGALGQYATDIQLAKTQEQKNALQRKIDSWCAIQKLYVPSLAMLRRNSDGPSEDEPQNTPLWLPSAICGKITCDRCLYSIEWDLRYAQANDALHDLRRNLQLRSHLYKSKDRFATGQRANTRALGIILRVQRYIAASAARYRVACKALLSLAKPLGKGSTWEASLLELHEDDIRGLKIGEDRETEGRRTVSWIWKRCGDLMSKDDDLHECMSSCPYIYYTS